MTLPTIGFTQGILHMVRFVEVAAEPYDHIPGGQQLHFGPSNQADTAVAVDAAKFPGFASRIELGRAVNSREILDDL